MEHNMQMRKSRVLQQIWPMLFTMRALGWLPVQRNNSDMLYMTKKTKIYCVIVLGLQLLPAAYITIRGLMLIPTLDPSLILFSYVQILCGVMMPAITTLFLFLQSPNQVKFWNKLRRILIGIEKISLSQKAFKFGKIKKISIISLILLALPMTIHMIIVPVVLKVTITRKLVFCMAFSQGTIMFMIGWWIAVTDAICITSQRLVDDFKMLCGYNKSGRTGILVGKLALKMRPLWLQLFHLAHILGEILSVALIMIMLNCFTFLAYGVYQLCSVQNIITLSLYIAINFMGFGAVYSFCSRGEKVIVQMMKFFIQLNQTSPRVSFSNYIFLQNKTFVAIISGIIANILVLYQLNINERSLQLQEVLSFGGGDIL